MGNIKVKTLMQVSGLLINDVNGNQVHWNTFGAGRRYPTAEEFANKYTFEEINGKLYLVDNA